MGQGIQESVVILFVGDGDTARGIEEVRCPECNRLWFKLLIYTDKQVSVPFEVEIRCPKCKGMFTYP